SRASRRSWSQPPPWTTRRASNHVSAGGITAELPGVAAPPLTAETGRPGRMLTTALFLAPATTILGNWMVFPADHTIIRCFFGQSISGVVSPAGVLSSASPSTPNLQPSGGGLLLKTPLHPGGVALLGVTGIAPQDVPSGAKQAVKPAPKPGDIVGTVWRDFRP